LLGLLTIRLGHLYVALVTLTFGLLMERLVFTRQIFANRGLGVDIERPWFAESDRAFTYLGIAVFCLAATLIVNVRRSTTGLALNAVRWSEPGSKTLGINVLQVKVLVSGLAAFVAGIGGAMLAMANGISMPGNYSTLEGLVWFAVVVTAGIHSNMAAFVGGITFTIWPAVMTVYLPHTFGQVPVILFGLGAVYIAKNPEGWVPQTADQIRWLVRHLPRWSPSRSKGPSGTSPATESPVSAEEPSVKVGTSLRTSLQPMSRHQ
jgi:branched-chain amino acid transport system permease protein